MMDRNQILGILNGMSTGSLIKMLATEGVKITDVEREPDEDDCCGSMVEDWNQRRVQTGPNTRPELFDRNRMIKMEIKQPRRPEPQYLSTDYEPDMDMYAADRDMG